MNIFLILWKVLMCSPPGGASTAIYICRIFYFSGLLSVVFWMVMLYIQFKDSEVEEQCQTCLSGRSIWTTPAGTGWDSWAVLCRAGIGLEDSDESLTTQQILWLKYSKHCCLQRHLLHFRMLTEVQTVLGEHSEELLLFVYPLVCPQC